MGSHCLGGGGSSNTSGIVGWLLDEGRQGMPAPAVVPFGGLLRVIQFEFI